MVVPAVTPSAERRPLLDQSSSSPDDKKSAEKTGHQFPFSARQHLFQLMLLIGLIASQARRYAYIDQKPIKALNHNADNAKLAIIAFSLPLQVVLAIILTTVVLVSWFRRATLSNRSKWIVTILTLILTGIIMSLTIYIASLGMGDEGTTHSIQWKGKEFVGFNPNSVSVSVASINAAPPSSGTNYWMSYKIAAHFHLNRTDTERFLDLNCPHSICAANEIK